MMIETLSELSPVLLALILSACSDYEYAEIGLTEVFHQPKVSESADVLFIIDNSGSMEEEQARLASNFEAFVLVLSESYADFQLGVATTDVGDAGALHGEVYTRDSTDLEDTFQTTVMVGTSGSKDERGFQSALLALDLNPTFTRDDARLNLVFLSDEDDHSPDLVEVYLQEFRSLAGTGGLLVHGIVGDQPFGCAAGGTAANAGVRYIEAIKTVGGYRDSICAEDYSDVLSRIGLQVVGLNDTFLLNDLPEPQSIEVWVDRVTMPNRQADGWTYEPGENAIVFHGRSIPRPGMEIFVKYLPLMGGGNQPEASDPPADSADTGS